MSSVPTRFLLPLGAFLVLAIILAIGVKHSPDNGVIKSPLIGKTVPDFDLPNLQDPSRHVSSADLKGHWYVFNVWGTWCPTCHEEHPWLLEYQKQGVVPIIGMDWNDQDDAALQYLGQEGNPYSTVIVDHDGRTAINFGVYAAPETFLVNPDGIIVYKCTGALTRDVWKREILPRIPKGAAKS
jgi:cytochrome c biogenesis protein CcmG, thiol:disulfide interchange protein DsbE